jgi:hypothetical protein
VLDVLEPVECQLVPACCSVARDRVVAHQLLADQEERGLDPRRVERVEHRGRPERVGAVVERERGPGAHPFERGHRLPALGGREHLAVARHPVPLSLRRAARRP